MKLFKVGFHYLYTNIMWYINQQTLCNQIIYTLGIINILLNGHWVAGPLEAWGHQWCFEHPGGGSRQWAYGVWEQGAGLHVKSILRPALQDYKLKKINK